MHKPRVDIANDNDDEISTSTRCFLHIMYRVTIKEIDTFNFVLKRNY